MTRVKRTHKPKTESTDNGDYQPTVHELTALKAYKDRAKANPPIRFKESSADGRVAIDHANRIIGKVLVMEALGTADQEFADGIIEQLAQASCRDGKVDVAKLNFALATIKGIAPRDPCEIMLALQMAAVHEATVAVAGRLAQVETIEQQSGSLKRPSVASGRHTISLRSIDPR